MINPGQSRILLRWTAPVAALILCAGCGNVSFPANPAEPDFYIAHMQDPNPVWVKRGPANPAPLSIASLPAGFAVNDIAVLRFSGGTDTLYLLSGSAGSLVVVGQSGAVFQPVATVAVGANPFALAIDDAAAFAYVSNSGSSSVTVVDLAANQPAATIALPAGSQPRGIAVTPDGKKVYVANAGLSTLSVIDTATRTVNGSITVGTQPNRLAISANGRELYAANSGSGTVSVVDVLTDTVSATLTGAANTLAAALSGSGCDLFVGQGPAAGAGSVALYDTATLSGSATATATTSNPVYLLGIGPQSFLAVDQAGGRVAEQWSTAGNPAVNRVWSTGVSPSAVAVARAVNRAVTTPLQCKLSVTAVGNGSVTASPASASGNYTCGANLTLTAVAASGSVFTGWSGNLAGSANPVPLAITADRSVTATFTALQTVVATVQANNPFVAGLSVTTDGVPHSGQAQYTAIVGSSHTHSTTSPQIALGTYYTFQNWSPSPTPNAATALTQTLTLGRANATYTANFTKAGYAVATYGCPVTVTSPSPALAANPLVYPPGATLMVNTSLPLIEVLQSGVWVPYSTFPLTLTLTGPISIWAPCVVAKTAACVMPPAGVAGWWGFDTAGATSVPDYSGNNNGGSVLGGSAQASGKVQGFLASGSTYFQAPPGSSLNFGTGPFAADLWVRWSNPASNLGDAWLISKTGAVSGVAHGFDLLLTRGAESPGLARLALRVTDGGVNSAPVEWDTVSPAVPSDGRWHLVAFSYDPTRNLDSRAAFFVDGAAVAATPYNTANTKGLSQTTAFNVSNAAPVEIGIYGATPVAASALDGGIDEVQLFNRTLAAGDLQPVLAADSQGQCKPGRSVTHSAASSPAGLKIQIDNGAAQTPPVQFSWNQGSAHSLGAPLPQSNAAGDTQYANPPVWTPGGPAISSAPSSATTYTATFAASGYKLAVNLAPANCAVPVFSVPLPASGFYPPGQTVGVTATPNPGFTIVSITGTVNGSVTLNQPQTVTVNCQAQAVVSAAYSPQSVGGNIILIHNNTGSVAATNLRLNSVVSNTTGIVFDQTVLGGGGVSFPWALGTLAAGRSASHNLGFRATSGSIGVPFSFTVKYQADNMAEQTVVIQVPFPR